MNENNIHADLKALRRLDLVEVQYKDGGFLKSKAVYFASSSNNDRVGLFYYSYLNGNSNPQTCFIELPDIERITLLSRLTTPVHKLGR